MQSSNSTREIRTQFATTGESQSDRYSIHLQGRNYQLQDIISSGAQGIVFQGHDLEKSSQPLAIKEVYGVVQIGQTTNPEISNIDTQVRLWRQLSSHNGFVKLHESGLANNGRYYIVMDFVAGETLEELATQNTRYSKEEAKKLLVSLLESLQQAHEKGILYRDVKPENIKMTENGPVFVDIGSIGDQYAKTQTISVGTLGYVAPEQMNLEPCVASDIYALGKTIYRVLTSQPVSKSELSVSDFTKLKTSYGSLGDIVEKMCQPDLAKRYERAKEVLEDINTGNLATPLVRVKNNTNNLLVGSRINTSLEKAWNRFRGGVISIYDKIFPVEKYTPLEESQRALIRQDYDNVCYNVDMSRKDTAMKSLKDARKRVVEYGFYDIAKEREDRIVLMAYNNAKYYNERNILLRVKEWENFANFVRDTTPYSPLVQEKTETAKEQK